MFWRVVMCPRPPANSSATPAKLPVAAAVSYPAGDLGTDHLHAGLPLAVNAVTQAERAKLVIRNCAGEHLLRFCAKSLDFLANGLIVLAFEV